MFEISDLRFKHILHIDHLVLDRAVTCLVGPSGSGKTTLLRHLNRLCEPDGGTVRYHGVPLTELDPVALRRRVVMLGQTPVLYGSNVADNLQIGLRLAQKEPAGVRALEETLRQVGLDKALDAPCHKLSGGEKQRLCLGRVLLMDAETYLLDEPSAALDKATEDFVAALLADFVQKRGRSLIIVTHSQQVSDRFSGGVVPLVGGRTEGYRDE